MSNDLIQKARILVAQYKGNPHWNQSDLQHDLAQALLAADEVIRAQESYNSVPHGADHSAKKNALIAAQTKYHSLIGRRP